jgi:hypothetical protein
MNLHIPLIFSASFLILFILFIIAMEMSEIKRINFSEILFMIYALGFTLEKVAAMQEHGIRGNQARLLGRFFLITSQFISRELG